MTQSDFRRLPLLVRPGQAAQVLGLRVRQLGTLDVADLVVRLRGLKEVRYRKTKLAELAGLRME